MSYMYKESKTNILLVSALVLLGVIILLSILPALVTTTYTNVTITDKSYSGSTDGYIVWVENESGTQYEFQNEDSLLRWKFNSGTVQGKLKEGSKYNITVTGWRIPFLSEYPNIIDYELVEEK